MGGSGKFHCRMQPLDTKASDHHPPPARAHSLLLPESREGTDDKCPAVITGLTVTGIFLKVPNS